MTTIQTLVEHSRLSSPADIARFHELRKEALNDAIQVYADRAESYNTDKPPTSEMVYGIVSLASEIYKRSTRLSSLLTPLRGEKELRQEDIDRILDTCIDTINYASWAYALMKIATDKGNLVDDNQLRFEGMER